jgi:IS30 family transposase
MNFCLVQTVTGRYLSFAEREEIALWRAQGVGVREVARRLGRSPPTISRERRGMVTASDIGDRTAGPCDRLAQR